MLRRQVALRQADLDPDAGDGTLDVSPFDLQFEFSQEELDGLREAFDRLADSEGKISFFDTFRKMEDDNIVSNDEKLVYGILKRVIDFSEMWGDARIDFNEFVDLLKKAMNMRQTRQQVDMLFSIFGAKETGHISAHHILRVSKELGQELSQQEVRGILSKCSQSGSHITFDEFL